jgi:hypothetical protein
VESLLGRCRASLPLDTGRGCGTSQCRHARSQRGQVDRARQIQQDSFNSSLRRGCLKRRNCGICDTFLREALRLILPDRAVAQRLRANIVSVRIARVAPNGLEHVVGSNIYCGISNDRAAAFFSRLQRWIATPFLTAVRWTHTERHAKDRRRICRFH